MRKALALGRVRLGNNCVPCKTVRSTNSNQQFSIPEWKNAASNFLFPQTRIHCSGLKTRIWLRWMSVADDCFPRMTNSGPVWVHKRSRWCMSEGVFIRLKQNLRQSTWRTFRFVNSKNGPLSLCQVVSLGTVISCRQIQHCVVIPLVWLFNQ